MQSSPCLTTLTLFGIGKGNVRWGLAQMGTSAPRLQKVPGLQFFKLMGSGIGKGFSLKPNFRRYGLLCTWQSEAAAIDFLQNSKFIQEYQLHTDEIWTVKMLPLQAHGQWDNQEPFSPTLQHNNIAGPLAVLTRASVNWRAIPSFCRFGSRTSAALNEAEGLLCSIGLGELPLVRQATFSIWQSLEAMKAFAYKQPHHQEVMRRTRVESWYSEELFARFIPISSQGTWDGADPLERLQLNFKRDLST
ncbi:spheroidene monooxygenase [Pontibacter silvestris]|uniref:Spheroidene monooxygenase n=1 Tax=Pontibacter silvestris TaxID=2305183 RepID=A0ABW4WZD5_9BACT|nr:spheroidene monooxygenase [Pontibacter silvestris]MCC9138260.1 spheroidene monooxygenase [Pontibacter silvestris]